MVLRLLKCLLLLFFLIGQFFILDDFLELLELIHEVLQLIQAPVVDV